MTPRVELLDLGLVDYPAGLARQREMFEELLEAASLRRTSGTSGREDAARRAGWLVLCEHPHVYTIGKSGRAENVLVGEEFLRSRGAALHRIGRGGDVTYHGPGQIVCYPVLDLERVGIGLREYIGALERSVEQTLARFGIEAGPVEGKTGVWVADEPRIAARGEVKEGVQRKIFAPAMAASSAERKICAIGVRASRGVVMHGFALNVATDLGWFEHINPCGFAPGAVTSIERELGRRVDTEEVKRILTERLEENLGIEIDR